ncbi:hypothetical protein NE865_06339 [Phthorimaea operculella]|nr:hypothetical protein NE865_06339 [Phthorimaea operculella]
MSDNLQKKFKRPKHKTLATTNPETPRAPPPQRDNEDRSECPEHVCPLLAKDSEWVDIMQSPFPNTPAPSSTSVGDEEDLLQLVECEDGPESEPLAIMFPGLLEQDPQMLKGIITKAMSTTEVTRHLVDLGAKANFQFMKKSNKLIPRDKPRLEKVNESDYSPSHCSFDPSFLGSSSSNQEDEFGNAESSSLTTRKKKILATKRASTSKEDIEPASPSTSTHSEPVGNNIVESATVAAAVKNQSRPIRDVRRENMFLKK